MMKRYKAAIFSLVVFLVVKCPFSTALCTTASGKIDKIKAREEIVDFKITWCQQRIHRYDWKVSLGPCLQSIPWESALWDREYHTDAYQSFVKFMDIKPSGFFSKIVIQSVSIARRNKTCGGDSWRVNIRGPSNMAATVYDKNDGSYQAVFLVMEPGTYRAEIVLDYTACNGYRDPPRDWFRRGKPTNKQTISAIRSVLNPGQTDSQVDASLQNQFLRTDLRRVAKRIRKSARESQKAVHFTHIIGYCVFVTTDYLRSTGVDLRWVAKR